MKRDEIAAYARSMKGKHRNEVGCAGTHAWCAQFVSYVLEQVGIKNVSNTFCTYLKNNMSNSPEWDEPESYPVAGDVIFFDWDHIQEERPLDHVAIVVRFSGTTITYINGNGSSSTYVTEQFIDVNNSSVAYWMRYVGDESDSAATAEPVQEEKAEPEQKKEIKYFTRELRQLEKGMSGQDVKSLQQLLIGKGYSCGGYGDDGDFGELTEKAVLNFQKESKLDADGIVGEQTFKKLWGF